MGLVHNESWLFMRTVCPIQCEFNQLMTTMTHLQMSWLSSGGSDPQEPRDYLGFFIQHPALMWLLCVAVENTAAVLETFDSIFDWF